MSHSYPPVNIAKTDIGPVHISTILCISGFSGSQVAETVIFIDTGASIDGLTDQDGERGAPHEARSMHDAWVRKVQSAIANTTEDTK